MPYAQMDDNMPETGKIARLSDAAFRAYVTSICFASRNLTDGLLLKSQAIKVGAEPRIIRELVKAQCWDEDPEGWRVHDYLDWNKSRAEVLAYRAKQRANANARWGAVGDASGIPTGDAKSMPNLMPSS